MVARGWESAKPAQCVAKSAAEGKANTRTLKTEGGTPAAPLIEVPELRGVSEVETSKKRFSS
jgi:hypothetical protein